MHHATRASRWQKRKGTSATVLAQHVGLTLCWIVQVRRVQQILNTQEDLHIRQWSANTISRQANSMSSGIGNGTCFTVIVGTQAFSSFKMLRHTVPDGKMLG